MDGDPEDQPEKPPKFEVPTNEKKVGFTFTNTCDEFQISLAQQAFDNIVDCEDIITLAYATADEQYDMENSGDKQYEHDTVVVLKQAIMTVAIDKTNSKSSVKNYYEATIHKLSRSGITSANEFIPTYDANSSSINSRLGNCGFIGMFSGTLEQIRSVITNIYNNDILPIKLSALEDDEIPMKYHPSEKALYQILHPNVLEMNHLLPIKWSNDVLKKLWWVNGNTMQKFKTLLLAGT